MQADVSGVNTQVGHFPIAFAPGPPGGRAHYIGDVVEMLDASRGRVAGKDELRARLRAAPAAYLGGAIENPHLGEREVLLLLGNPAATPSLLGRVAADPRFSRLATVRRAALRNPRLPPASIEALVPMLDWGELAAIATDRSIPPPTRRRAEERLRERLNGMTLGERVAFARRSPRRLLEDLARTADDAVLRSILGNVEATERIAVAIAASTRTPPDALDWIASHPVWSCRTAVRVALAGNPSTRVATALRIVQGLPAREIEHLVANEAAPRLVRVGAARRGRRSALRARETEIG